MPPKANAERTIERTSIGEWVDSPRLVIHFAPRARAMSPIGRTMPKSQRQPRLSSTMPDIVGPIAGASEMTRPTRPIIRPRECGGTTFIIVVISSGIMMPVPAACTIASDEKHG
jgi:hypothetical protein